MPIAKEQRDRKEAGMALTHRVVELPGISKRAKRLSVHYRVCSSTDRHLTWRSSSVLTTVHLSNVAGDRMSAEPKGTHQMVIRATLSHISLVVLIT